MANSITGSCCCGNIRYTTKATKSLWYCHCQQCRKMTGHYMAAAQARLSDIEIVGQPKWHYVSATARYGFCPDCGSPMFWRNDNNEFLSITGGSMDNTSTLDIGGHIFVGEKGGYYQIPNNEKRHICWNDAIEHC